MKIELTKSDLEEIIWLANVAYAEGLGPNLRINRCKI